MYTLAAFIFLTIAGIIALGFLVYGLLKLDRAIRPDYYRKKDYEKRKKLYDLKRDYYDRKYRTGKYHRPSPPKNTGRIPIVTAGNQSSANLHQSNDSNNNYDPYTPSNKQDDDNPWEFDPEYGWMRDGLVSQKYYSPSSRPDKNDY